MSASAIDLSVPQHVHIVGIGGAGMSAIAAVLVGMGHTVSGSDLKASSGFLRLQASGVRVDVGHDAANVADADLVAAFGQAGDDNLAVAAQPHADGSPYQFAQWQDDGAGKEQR